MVSFLLFTYNQESYIEKALLGALSQTYRPLELIISDDCSTDNTFSIVERAILSYSGDINIIIRQSKFNLGVIRHVEEVVALSKGDFIVTAAGDDISKPNRTTRLVNRWVQDKKQCVVFSNANVIDAQGSEHGFFYDYEIPDKTLLEYLKGQKIFVGGFGQGFTPSLFRDFNKITAKTFQEDAVIAFRAILKGGIYYIDEPLLFYRRHSSNAYSTSSYISCLRLFRSELGVCKQSFLDAKMASWLPKPVRYMIMKKILLNIIKGQFIVWISPLYWALFIK
ncbi:hypothetical protein AOC28_06945 [Polynucleobacter sp. MWH-Adler-W8]|nr:hypothetical protein AOC28_06945 [Polynucleobacter sp. MWH-Adler-W8]